MTQIQKDLFAMQEGSYKAFHCRLIPTVPENTIIGVRVPLLRSYAKRLVSRGLAETFMMQLPHTYYEENMLHGLLISGLNDFSVCVEEVNKLLPYVDNWAVCDSIRPKCFLKHHHLLLPEIEKWLSSKHPYTVRFGIEMLMVHFLGQDFQVSFLKRVGAVSSDEYYVNMMIAWYFATALAKQWETTIPYFQENRLTGWIHNKAIQKALESYRIAPQKKTVLKTLRRR